MQLSYNVESLLQQRYYQPNENWPTLVKRVTDFVCEGESQGHKERVHQQLLNRVWLPNSPCLVNAGLKNGGMMACFTVGPDSDTLENHVAVLGDIAAVGKRGGGAGFTGASIRAEGSPVSGSAHGFAYGPNAWALRVSEYLDMITQGGFRKMALMYTLPVEHPDIHDFVDLKQKNERLGYNFNQSIWASDSWLRGATNGNGPASSLLYQVASNAWNNGEPGILFGDTINNNSPYSTCGCKIETTNPCGEQPLPAYGSCNLGSINISHEVFYREDGQFRFSVLDKVVKDITTFLDNIGSRTIFPNEKFEKWYNDHRPIGIGIMGYADALLRLKQAYGSSASLKFLKKILFTIKEASYRVSTDRGREKGIPAHNTVVGRRNMTTVSIAPTGSIAFIAECSHGIEPVFSPKYQRTDERGNTYLFEHPLGDEPYFRSSINPVYEKMPTWKEHVDVQAAAQKYCDSGVSKTINLVNGSTIETVKDVLVYAWKSGVKGITIYRDGSRDTQVLDDLTEEDEALISCPSGVCSV